jgi:hypothetical protein
LVITLRSLQSAADNQNSEAQMTWAALNASNDGMGAPDIDYDRFAAQWDAEGEEGVLHQLVDRFDGHGLVIKTNNGQEPAQQSQHKEREGAVAKMAKRATKLGK